MQARRSLMILCLSLGASSQLLAQRSGRGTIGGVVTDVQRAAVPGATVIVRNEATGVESVAASNRAGAYTSAPLVLGPYSLTVSLPGFKKAAVTSIELRGGDVVRRDIVLEIGELHETILDLSSVWLLYAGTVLLLLLANELGYRVGRWRRTRMPEGEKTSSTAIQGSTLGLLAFMLAFTFGMSVSRFDTRKQLVLDEASAILRAYQRAQLLPEPFRADSSRLLREYVELRVQTAATSRMADVAPLLKRSEGVQDELWQHAKALSEKPSPVLNLFLQSLSELTDLQLKRVRAAAWNRLPRAIVATLYAIAFLALCAMGYGAGLADSRTVIPSVMLILTFSAIIVLIVDLDRPRQQLFQVVQEPISDVARRMAMPAPTP